MARAKAQGTVLRDNPLTGRMSALAGATVKVYENHDLGSPIAADMYDSKTGGSILLWPLTADTNGMWKFYLDVEQQVSLVYSYPGRDDVTIHDVNVEIPVDEQATDGDIAGAVSGLVSSASLSATLAAYLTTAAAAAGYAPLSSLGDYIAKAFFAAAGDLITASGDDTPVILPKGSAGQLLRVNAAGTALEWFSPPYCELTRSSGAGAQSIPDSTLTDLLFDQENEDASGMHNGTNTDRITVVEPGVYHIEGGAAFPSNATGERVLQITKNGTIVRYKSLPGAGVSVAGLDISTDVRCVATDIIRLRVYQTSGGALNVNRTADYTPYLSARWTRP